MHNFPKESTIQYVRIIELFKILYKIISILLAILLSIFLTLCIPHEFLLERNSLFHLEQDRVQTLKRIWNRIRKFSSLIPRYSVVTFSVAQRRSIRDSIRSPGYLLNSEDGGTVDSKSGRKQTKWKGGKDRRATVVVFRGTRPTVEKKEGRRKEERERERKERKKGRKSGAANK